MRLNSNSILTKTFRFFSSNVSDSNRECYIKDLGNGLSKIILNRPHKLNSLGKQILLDLKECISYANDNCKVVIIESSCEKAFSTGADLKERLEMNPEQTIDFVRNLRQTFDNLSKLKCPTIACIDGLALGGGLELALACDLRVASFKSKLGFPETKLSIFPAAGGTQRLSWLIGPAKAKELIFAAETVDADYAKILGILNHVQENSAELSEAIASKILNNGPLGILGAKRAIDSGFSKIIDDGLKAEDEQYALLLNSEDRIEGLKAFSEKRAPIYKGK